MSYNNNRIHLANDLAHLCYIKLSPSLPFPFLIEWAPSKMQGNEQTLQFRINENTPELNDILERYLPSKSYEVKMTEAGFLLKLFYSKLIAFAFKNTDIFRLQAYLGKPVFLSEFNECLPFPFFDFSPKIKIVDWDDEQSNHYQTMLQLLFEIQQDPLLILIFTSRNNNIDSVLENLKKYFKNPETQKRILFIRDWNHNLYDWDLDAKDFLKKQTLNFTTAENYRYVEETILEKTRQLKYQRYALNTDEGGFLKRIWIRLNSLGIHSIISEIELNYASRESILAKLNKNSFSKARFKSKHHIDFIIESTFIL